ncbi:MAG: FAD/NAD(P)-binding protein [Spirochaetales bacterium]|nr:FAD/NAD(P)-binding protein [Spirochaetales bacterium]
MRENTGPEPVPYMPESAKSEFPFLFLPHHGMVPYGGPPGSDKDADAHWAVIGGGVHGTCLVNALIHGGGVKPSRILIFDPHDSLLSFWHRATGNTGMTHLRSSSVHHLDYYPVSLRQFYGAHRSAYPDPFIPLYNRPSLSLFNDHAAWIIAREGLEERHLGCRIDGLERRNGLWLLRSGSTSWTSVNVILAVGLGEQPRYPSWARPCAGKNGERGASPVFHLFEDGWAPASRCEPGDHRVIVGAGISGLQTALFHSRAYPENPVVIVADHPLRSFDFDSDPGFIGPRKLETFAREQAPGVRRTLIEKVRYPGTGDPALVARVRDAIERGEIRFIQGGVKAAEKSGRGIDLVVSPSQGGSEERIHAGQLILATGFSSRRPGGFLVDRLIADYSLPVAACGYPVTDVSLRWGEGLYVTGPLSELETGPVARNIAGAKRAAERIVAAITGKYQ